MYTTNNVIRSWIPLTVASTIQSMVSSLLGSRGSLKCIVDDDVHILTNCAARLLQDLHIEHPVGYVINEACQSHHKQYRTGCKTLCVLIGLYMKQAQQLIQQGVPVLCIVQGFRDAIEVCIDNLAPVTVNVDELLHDINKEPDIDEPSVEADNTAGNEINDAEDELTNNQSNDHIRSKVTYAKSNNPSSERTHIKYTTCKSSFTDQDKLLLQDTPDATDAWQEIIFTCKDLKTIAKSKDEIKTESLNTDFIIPPIILKESTLKEKDTDEDNDISWVFDIESTTNESIAQEGDEENDADALKSLTKDLSEIICGIGNKKHENHKSDVGLMGISPNDEDADESDDEFDSCFDDIPTTKMTKEDSPQIIGNLEKPKRPRTSAIDEQDDEFDSCFDGPPINNVRNTNTYRNLSVMHKFNNDPTQALIKSSDCDIPGDEFSECFQDITNQNTLTNIIPSKAKIDNKPNISIQKSTIQEHMSKDCLSLNSISSLLGALGKDSKPSVTQSPKPSQSRHFRTMNDTQDHRKVQENMFLYPEDNSHNISVVKTTEHRNGNIPWDETSKVKSQYIDRTQAISKDQSCGLTNQESQTSIPSVSQCDNKNLAQFDNQHHVQNFQLVTKGDQSNHQAPQAQRNTNSMQHDEFYKMIQEKLKETKPKVNKAAFHLRSRHLMDQESEDIKVDELGTKDEVMSFTNENMLLNDRVGNTMGADQVFQRTNNVDNESEAAQFTGQEQHVISDNYVTSPKQPATMEKGMTPEKLVELGKALKHGEPEVIDLAIEAIKKLSNHQQTISIIDTNQFHTMCMAGPEEMSCVVEGIVIATELSSLHHFQKATHNAIFVNGDLSDTYHHIGYKKAVTVHIATTGLASRSSSEKWFDQAVGMLRKFQIGLIICKGRISSELKDWCISEKIIPIESAPMSALQALAVGVQAQLLTYIDECTKVNIGSGIGIQPWQLDSGIGIQPWQLDSGIGIQPWQLDSGIMDNCYIKLSLHRSMVQTIVICHPVASVRYIREEQFWHTLYHLKHDIGSGKLLQGAGATELHCSDILETHHSSKDCVAGKYHRVRSEVYKAVAGAFRRYVAIIEHNNPKSQLPCHTPSHNIISLGTESTHNSNTSMRISDQGLIFDDFDGKIESWRSAIDVVCTLLQTQVHISTGEDSTVRDTLQHTVGYI
ncbi:unnamed protein product [Owenia fusiformis]|uniref:Uncharacterized protein n=1 Tax=Owenia fusiformis TaxID=6347 RepID=A0A8J1UL46_OWEFU|nr:unnamed protein product [Owenia fusiformis]